MPQDDRSDVERRALEGLSSQFRMTDLEETLFGPGGVERARELLQRIDQLKADLQVEIKGGLPPERFKKAETVGNSLAAARDLLVRILQLLERV